ncbi:MAG: Crp/Fnr family transcriptional regulator [Pseudomonadota bacterium]
MIRSRSLCAALSPIELTALNGISRHRTVAAGQVIVTEGEPDVFGNVVTGLLAERKSLPDGREQIVSLLFPADFHGNAQNTHADTTVTAIVRSTVCQFDRTAFDNLMVGYPALRQAVTSHAFDALQDAREWMLLLGQKTATERVATFLIRMAQRQAATGCAHTASTPVGDGALVEIPITRAQMAAYLGLTIETVSRRLTALRDQKLLSFEEARLVRLDDVAALRRASGMVPA